MTGWTPERVARLRELYAARMFYSGIAQALGTTRGAVASKIRSLGLSAPGQPRPQPTRKSIEPIMEPPMPELEPEPPPAIGGVHMLELTARTCRFPLWGFHEEPNFMHCGAQVAKGSVYCKFHARVCHQVPQPHRKRVEVG